jgi:hypothetical protein
LLADVSKAPIAARLFTLGVVPNVIRSTLLTFAYVPAHYGFTYWPTQFLFAVGAVLISHPFEVARILIQNGQVNKTFGSIRLALSQQYQ